MKPNHDTPSTDTVQLKEAEPSKYGFQRRGSKIILGHRFQRDRFFKMRSGGKVEDRFVWHSVTEDADLSEMIGFM